MPTELPTQFKLSTQLAGRQVLVVEDDPNIASVLAYLLEEAGAEVVVANSASQALQKLRRDSLEIILSDLGLPDRNGGDLLQCIRFRHATAGRWIPAIALTGMTGEDARQRAQEAGFNRYLTKPINIEELISTLLDLLPTDREEKIQS